MAKIEMRNEVMFKAPTRVGLLADVTEALYAAGVNILAIGAYDKGANGEFLMITDNNKLAFEALDKLDGDKDLQSVIVAEVSNKPGELAAIAECSPTTTSTSARSSPRRQAMQTPSRSC